MAYNQACILIQNCIGIGTDTPSATLHVVCNANQDNIGTIRYENANTGTGSATNAQLLGVNKYGCGQYMMWEEKGMRIGLRSVTNSGCGDLHFTAGSDSTKMVIRCNGNIDIQSGNVLNIYRADNTRALQLYTTNDETVIDSWAASSEPLMIRSNGTGGRIVFHTNGAERLRINCAGNVGIGTSSPLSLLQVNGESRIIYSKAVASNPLDVSSFSGVITVNTNNINGSLSGIAMYANSDYNAAAGIFASRTSGISADMVFYAGSATAGERMRITSDGNVGIGTTSPSVKLHICDANAGGTDDMIRLTQGNVNNHAYLRSERCNGALVLMGATRNSFDGCIPSDSGIFWSFCNNPIVIGTCNRERVRFATNGNVGIGISSPSYLLHVNGTFYAAGSSQDYKTSVCQYDTDSCMFMKLKPVTYQYKDEYKHLGKELKSETQIGLIAEEVAEVMPELSVQRQEDYSYSFIP
jgi:hypothetical protein